MRIQLALLILLISLNVLARDDKAMKELFDKYDKVMDEKKVELVDEVFSQKFLRDSGGKAKFIEKVKELPKDGTKTILTWKKGVRDQIYFAKLSPLKKSKDTHGAEFIVIQEGGKLKIDGTVSDGD